MSNIPENFIYSGEKAWHGTGIEIPTGTDVYDAIMSNPVLSSSIEQVPVMRPSVKAGGSMFVDVPNVYAVVRQYDDRQLGTVGDRYCLIQPKDAAEFLSRVSKEFDAKFETAGLLRGGAQFFAQAKIGADIDLGPLSGGSRDTVRRYVTFGDSYDGKRKAEIGLSSTRAVCENTIGHALSEAKSSAFFHAIRHTGDVQSKLDDVAAAIDKALDGFARFQKFAETAAATPMSMSTARDVIETLWPDSDSANARNTRVENRRLEILDLFATGTGNSGETAWHLYNGITEWLTWHAPVRTESAQESRLFANLFGTGAEIAAQAQRQIELYL